MKIEATRSTALVAGAWTSFSFGLFGRWTPPRNINDHVVTLIYLVACLIFWILPAVVFASGFDLKRWDPDYANQPDAQADRREIYVRIGFWFLGSFVCSLALRLAVAL